MVKSQLVYLIEQQRGERDDPAAAFDSVGAHAAEGGASRCLVSPRPT